MSPVELLKEAIKTKSWPMARVALRELEGVTPIVAPADTSVPKGPSRPNFFSDDGTSAKVQVTQVNRDGSYNVLQEAALGEFAEDKSVIPKVQVERKREKFKPKYLKCSVCKTQVEVDNNTYAYYTKPFSKNDEPTIFTCPNC